MQDLKRFIKYVKILNNDCWEWRGALDIDGYGIFRLYKKNHRAHRASYMLFNEIELLDSKMHMDHLCRYRSCVNPDHLELVTPRENTLRGLDAKAAINARKTHCDKGHEFTKENTYCYVRKTPKRNSGKISGRPERMCRCCQRNKKKARFEKARQARIVGGEIITMGPKPKLYCKYGHPKSGDNLHVGPTGIRYCKTCSALKMHRYRSRKQQEILDNL